MGDNPFAHNVWVSNHEILWRLCEKSFRAAVHTTNYNNANFSQISVCPRLHNDDNV